MNEYERREVVCVMSEKVKRKKLRKKKKKEETILIWSHVPIVLDLGRLKIGGQPGLSSESLSLKRTNRRVLLCACNPRTWKMNGGRANLSYARS